MEVKIPHNIEAEQAVLSAMFITQEAALKALELLTAQDFYRESHKLIFAAMAELLDKGQQPEPISVIDLLRQRCQLEAVGAEPYVLQLNNYMPTTANMQGHIRIVKREALKRRLLEECRVIAARANTEDEPEQQLYTAIEELTGLANNQKEEGLEGMASLLETGLELVTRRSQQESGCSGLATCFRALDVLTCGLQPSDFIILAARPSMGKTAMALNILANVLLAGSTGKQTVAFFSLEMSKAQLMTRLFASVGEISSSRLRSGKLSERDWSRLWTASDRLNGCSLYIDDTPGIGVSAIRARCLRLQSAQGLDLVVIDYIQLLEGIKGHGSDRQQEMSEISRRLKGLARELGVPVLALSQLSRGVEGRQMKRPILSDIRESGAIEQDADLVAFLYREDYYKRSSEEKGVTELIIAKHRNGPIGTLRFLFDKNRTRFIELE